MIRKDDMDRGAGKPPPFDGSNYAYWKIRMSAYLQSLDYTVWEIVENEAYAVLAPAARITQEQKDQHNANSCARSVLFSSLLVSEFERVSDCTTAREIWQRLQAYHEGTAQVKNRLYETYKREYENFNQLDGESIDSLFSRFQTVINKMRANKAQLPYDDHERALKLLHALDPRVWGMRVTAITESSFYDTLTVDELFSKLKAAEIDQATHAKIRNPTSPSMALVSGNGGNGAPSSPNPSQLSFSLSSLVTVTEEQLEVLGDDELALVINRFSWFHNNQMNRRRGGRKEGCFECGNLDHFISDCPKRGKSSSKHDHSKRRDKKEYTSDKHKVKYFDKEEYKKKFHKKMWAKQRAFLASLSDIDDDSGDDQDASSSDDEATKKVEDKLNGLCFVATSNLGGFAPWRSRMPSWSPGRARRLRMTLHRRYRSILMTLLLKLMS